MQDILGSVRRSIVFRAPADTGDDSTPGTLFEKINSSIRMSRVFSRLSPSPPTAKGNAPAPPIRWRKGELIGCGAFGQVYMGMNLDTGELLAVKQVVLIAANSASKENAQAHIRELEEEVKLLKNLSHPNIVRYLGTVREEGTLNILLEFVPGGSIASLLGKFGSFPEAVIRMYTKQLLLGLDYLHKNGIMHRDIKGANILVDNKGCIKLADFGASKQVVEQATATGAKSMKGTPYWMAPEVIRQTGHSCSADIWSVGCTVIEMATGKPPWSQRYQEQAAALFHIGTTKSHPPIPEHLSIEAIDFLLKCLQKEPEIRPVASELLQHPFVTGEPMRSAASHTSFMQESSKSSMPSYENNVYNSPDSMDVCNLGTLDFSRTNSKKLLESRNVCGGNNSVEDLCRIDDKDDITLEARSGPLLVPDDVDKSSNPMCEPSDDWKFKYDEPSEIGKGKLDLDNCSPLDRPSNGSGLFDKCGNDFAFHSGASISEDDDEVTESKIQAFLDEKALELKILQTPLYEEFYNSLNAPCSPNLAESKCNDSSPNYLKLPPKSRSPNRVPIGTPSPGVDAITNASHATSCGRMSNVSSISYESPQDISSPQPNELKGHLVDAHQEPSSPSMSYLEIQKKWKEELDEELEKKREMMRQVGVGGKTSSPKDRALSRQKERSRFASPGK